MKLNTLNIHYGGGQHVSLADVQKIKAMGFNGIRVHIYWGLIQPSGPTSINSAYFTAYHEPLGASLDQLVNWCVANNLYIILNPTFTQTWSYPSWFSGNVGDYAATQKILDNVNGAQDGIDYMYEWMANHYATVPNVVWEGFNEMGVSDASYGGSKFGAFNVRWVTAIERGEQSGGGQSHLKIIEYLMYGGAYVEIFNPEGGCNRPNVMWAPHNYAPMHEWDPSGPEGVAYVQSRIHADTYAQTQWGQPVLSTEWSKDTGQAQWQLFFTTVLNAFKTEGFVGWSFWCYCSNPNAESVYTAPGSGAWNLNNPSLYAQIYPILEPYLADQPVPILLTVLSNVEVPVTVDGQPVGNTPATVQVEPGVQHTVSVPPEITVD